MTDPTPTASGDLEAAIERVNELLDAAPWLLHDTNHRIPGCLNVTYSDLSALAIRPANPPATAAGVGEAVAWLCTRENGTSFAVNDHPGEWPNLHVQPLYTSPRHVKKTVETEHVAASHDALIARVREVLEPFAKAADFWDAIYDDSEVMKVPAAFVDAWRNKHGKRKPVPQFVNGDLRKARALLNDLDARDGG